MWGSWSAYDKGKLNLPVQTTISRGCAEIYGSFWHGFEEAKCEGVALQFENCKSHKQSEYTLRQSTSTRALLCL